MQCKICQAEFDAGSDEALCPACRAKVEVTALEPDRLATGSLGFPATETPKAAASQSGSQGRQVWQSTASGDYRPSWPISVAVHPSGEILVLDEPEDYRILRLDRSGRSLGVLAEIPVNDREGGVEDPQGLCVDAAGTIYVPDAGNDRISIWNRDGGFSHWLGSTGSEPGQFAHPGDVDVDEDGFLYVADSFNRRIQKLSADGVVSLEVENMGQGKGFREPVAITTDAKGNIYVADAERNLVVTLSPDGVPLQWLPGPRHEPDLFDGPGDIRIGPDGSLYISDCRNLRVRRFDSKGALLGVVDLSHDEEENYDGGDIALLDQYVLIPDRLNDRVLCMELEDVNPKVKR